MKLRWLAGTLLGCLALVLAACSSSNGASSSSSTSGSTPIVIGTICSCSGPYAGDIAGAKPVMSAWEKWTNAHGGINGHPVSVVIEDDSGIVANGVSDAKQLVEQDHVAAIVGQVSTTIASWAPYVEQQGIPVIGGLQSSSFYGDSPDFFPVGATQDALSYGPIAAGKTAKGTTVGTLFCAEAPQCGEEVPTQKSISQQLGLTYSYSDSVSATAPSYTAPCLASKAAGVNLLYIVLGTTTAVQLATACSSQGYTPTYLANDGTLTYSWRTAPALDGALVAEATFPFFDDSIPATQEAQDALKKYAPGVIDSSVYGGHVSEVWSAGQMFAAAATAGHVGPTSTSSQVKTGLYDLHNETLDGLIPPITYTKGQGTQAKCYYIISVENGKFTEPNGLHYSCQP